MEAFFPNDGEEESKKFINEFKSYSSCVIIKDIDFYCGWIFDCSEGEARRIIRNKAASLGATHLSIFYSSGGITATHFLGTAYKCE